MKKQLQIFTTFAFLTLPNLCASNEIETDIEMGISPASSPIMLEKTDQATQTNKSITASEIIERVKITDTEIILSLTKIIEQKETTRDNNQSSMHKLFLKSIFQLATIVTGGIILGEFCYLLNLKK